MTTIKLEKAQQQLPDLIKRAMKGEEILITADDNLVRLAPMTFNEELATKRGYGLLAGQFEVDDAFFDPLPDDELDAFEGRDGK